MNLYKTIIQGRLEFGNVKSYDKVFKMFLYRAENYYKSDIILDPDEIFDDKTYTLYVKRYVGTNLEKSWKNAVALLEYCAQFAVSGEMGAWQTDNGKILNSAIIEPESDKAAVIQFRKGKKLAGEEGKEKEALEALSKAIEKYDKHAQAYERRANVNFILKKHHDAMRDYNKCINLDDSIPNAYYGRARIHMINEDIDSAIEDFDRTLKKSIALQAIYWKARRMKANCHIEKGEFEKAAFDLKLFTNRKFTEDNPNFKWKVTSLSNYGKVLLELEQYEDALKAFDLAFELDKDENAKENGKRLYFRGIAKQKAGKSGFIKDIKQAAELGVSEAEALLKEIA